MQSRLLSLAKSKEIKPLTPSHPVHPRAPVYPGVPQRETGPTGLAPHSGPCLPEAFPPQSLWRESSGKGERLERWVPSELFLWDPGLKLPAWVCLIEQPVPAAGMCCQISSPLLKPFPRPGMSSLLPVSWWASSHPTRHHSGSGSRWASLVDNSSVSHLGERWVFREPSVTQRASPKQLGVGDYTFPCASFSSSWISGV